MFHNDGRVGFSGYCKRAAATRQTPTQNDGRGWWRNEGGSTGIVFALSMTLMVSLAGGAVDFGRAYLAKEQAQKIADAAVLAAARTWQIENNLTRARDRGQTYFLANKPAELKTATSEFMVDEVKNTITLQVTASTTTPFLSVLGIKSLDAQIFSQAQLARGETAMRSLEVSMMLDVTGSMAGNKLTALKAAASDLVDILVWDNQGEHTSRVALVPFAEGVRPGLAYLKDVRGQRASQNRFQDNNGFFQTYKLTECVSDRKGNEALTDAAPVGDDKAGPLYTKSGGCAPGSAIVPLTNQKSTLKTAIQAMTTGGLTAGQIGTQWAWYMLSPNWNSIWPESAAAPYNSGVIKVAVLMTDGEYNLAYDDAGVATRDSGRTASNGSADGQARLLCEAMKAKGITIFSVGFELSSEKAGETLRQCATDPSYVYMAENGETLRAAFKDIGQRLSTFHLSQ